MGACATVRAMSRISREEVERIAGLARLSLAPDEASGMAADLDTILGYVEKLQALDTAEVPPTSHPMPLATPFREDRPVRGLAPEVAVENAPDAHGTAFGVPAVLEGEDEEG